jgi:hypothetical protein
MKEIPHYVRDDKQRLYMNKAFEELYNDFLADIDEARQPGLTHKERVEQCFWRAKKYWELLKTFIRKNSFEDENAEIDFFKNVKPAFTCYIEYYVLLSEALHSVPGSKPTDSKEIVVTYWKREFSRCQRFTDKNKLFVQYYESGGDDMDDYYFLRINNTSQGPLSMAPVYEEDTEFCTNGDPIVRSHLAYKKYNTYVLTQLTALQTSEAT